jgi:DNA polymerase-3 subunit alpha
MMMNERGKFEEGCQRSGYGKDLGKELFDVIVKFADYAFAKSHAYGYGLISYQTAYLKAHYPVEYVASLLTSVKTNYEKAAVYLADARQSKIAVLTPDINTSGVNFAPVVVNGERKITFGLSAIRNVGEGLVGHIVDERQAGGGFTSFYDFCERVPEQALNKRTVESLIKAGAFDALGHPRKGLLMVYESIIDTTVMRRRERDQGVMSLFGDLEPSEGGYSERQEIPDLSFDKTEQLKFEKEMLGLYVSDHPLMGIEGALRRRVDCSIPEAMEREDGSFVVVGGLVNGLSRRWTKKGDQMATFTLEDLQGSVEVTLFPKTLQKYGHQLADDILVGIKGRVDRRDDTRLGLMAMEVTVLEGLRVFQESLHIRLSPQTLSESTIEQLKAMLTEHAGNSPVFVHIGSDKAVRLGSEFNVNLDHVMGPLRVAFGDAAYIE